MSVPSSGPDAAHTILTVTENPGEGELFTTAADHGLDGIAPITTTGVSNPTYNASGLVPVVLGSNTFTLGLGYVGDATGGQWELT